MDSIIQSCPKCHHVVSIAGGACAYCGTPMSGGEPPGRTDEKITAEKTLATPSAPPLQSGDAPPAAEMPAESVVSPPPPGSAVHAEAGATEAAGQEIESPEAETETLLLTDAIPEKAVEEIDLDLNTNEAAAEPKRELTSGSLGDTILLEPADEILPAVADKTETVAASANSEISAPSFDPRARPQTSAIIAKARVDAGAVKEPAEGGISAEVLKIEKAALDMVAATQKQKLSSSNPDELEKHKATEAETQALKRQKASLAKARALKKQNLILAKAAALKRKKAAQARALTKQKQAQADLEAAYPEEAVAAPVNSPGGRPAVADEGATSSMMQTLLKKYQGRAIGINFDNSMEVKEAKLVEANSEFFSVFVQDKKLHYSYPLKNIFTVIEGKDGVEAGDSKKQGKFKAVIKVYPPVPF